MRILYGHGYAHAGAFGGDWMENWLARLRAAGSDVESVQLGWDTPGRRLDFPELDRRWQRGDPTLLRFYELLARRVEGFDVLVNAGALNLHPDFLAMLPTFNVLYTNDDPEGSHHSRPVALAHDLCAIGNIAEVETYRSWGVREVCWVPMGFRAADFDPRLTKEQILTRTRPTDVALLCERQTAFRRRRVDAFARAFPQGVYRGPGWPKGFLPEDQRVPLLQNTRIGINIHNSTGPINFRLYYLPANGVMQLCDNKSHLGRVFELGTEVVGFDTVDEAIEMCRYYLAHEDERRAIAAAGWERSLRDYNEVAVFRRFVNEIEARLVVPRPADQRATANVIPSLRQHHTETRSRRVLYAFQAPVVRPARFAIRAFNGLARRVHLRLDNFRLWLDSRGKPVAG